MPVTKISFGAFTLNLETRQLLAGERQVHLTPKAFELLRALIVDRPKVLSKAMLQDTLWPDTTVIEANLANLVAELRAALGDQARAPVFIRTAHGYGYAFCGEAAELAAEKSAGRRSRPVLARVGPPPISVARRCARDGPRR